MAAASSGPDLVIAGAARSGTSYLAAQFATHPEIDPGQVKEPNYYSRRFDRGPEWYEGLYEPRRPGLLRLDASTSYTSPRYPEALDRLIAASPRAVMVYSVRHPIERAVSHYLLRHHYFHIEPGVTFGAALAGSDYYYEGSDYSHWLGRLTAGFGEQHVLLVPFELVTARPEEASAAICRLLGVAPPRPAPERAERHRNSVVVYRHELTRRAARRLRQSRAYPKLRSALGPSRLRRTRQVFTRRPELPSTEQALASCTPQQHERLRQVHERAAGAVHGYLVAQDQRLGLAWAKLSFAAEQD